MYSMPNEQRPRSQAWFDPFYGEPDPPMSTCPWSHRFVSAKTDLAIYSTPIGRRPTSRSDVRAESVNIDSDQYPDWILRQIFGEL